VSTNHEDRAVIEQAMGEGEAILTLLVDTFRNLRSSDRVEGATTDDGALGGVGMVAEGLSRPMASLVIALAARRLADAEVVTR
jgi:hypothetical protein